MNSPANKRLTDIERLKNFKFDLIVIGGGITGVGIALDAQSRGLKVALIEKDDFSSGTSSKSSKLVHGGLRYLQQKEVKLVYESLAERQRLLLNAPHIVRPLPFLIPLYGRKGVANKSFARLMSLALTAYDITGGFRVGKLHKRISAEDTLRLLPSLKKEIVAAGMIYYDARTDDSRLTLTVAKTAENYGATMVNYAEAVGFVYDSNSKVTGVKAKVRRFGSSNDDYIEIQINSKVIINATGVYSDEVRLLDEGSHPQSIVPAKGVHIAVEGKKLPCNIACVIPVKKDKRSIFVIPWGNETYIGTTDTQYSGDLFNPDCTKEDIDYLINAVNDSTTANLKPSDVLGAWSGLRPLLKNSSKGAKLSSKTADLSRQHKVTKSQSNVITVTGGKLTTYRRMAEDCVDMACEMLNAQAKCRTKRLSLMGAPVNNKILGIGVVDKRPQPKQGADVILYDHLYSRYGTVADDLISLMNEKPELAEPLMKNQPYRLVEAHYAIHHEWAQTIDDILSRRTRAVIFDEESTLDAVNNLAEFMAAELDWNQDFKVSQIDSFKDSVSKFYSFEGNESK